MLQSSSMQDAVRHLSPILTAETWVRLKGKKQNKSNNGGKVQLNLCLIPFSSRLAHLGLV